MNYTIHILGTNDLNISEIVLNRSSVHKLLNLICFSRANLICKVAFENKNTHNMTVLILN